MLPLQLNDVPASYAGVTGLIEDFDYKPNTSHTDGIARFIKWYKKFYKI
jgi:UDP-glucuronate 4-epimerase